MDIRKKKIRDEVLTIEDKSIGSAIGPNVSLERCTLSIKVPSKLIIFADPCDLVDCTIKVACTFANCQWWGKVACLRCKFLGRYKGNDFGKRDIFRRDMFKAYGSIEDCDFSDAKLDLCRFFNTDMSRVKLPKWPNVTVLNPSGLIGTYEKVQWRGGMKTIVGVIADSPPGTDAITFFVPEIIKRHRCTEEDIRHAIKHFGNVVMWGQKTGQVRYS